MNRINTFATILFSILTVNNTYGEINEPTDDSKVQDTLVIKDASLFCEVDFPIHGIAFNNQGLMYVGAHKKIHTITPDKEVKHFITLNDATDNTMIWSLRFDPNKYLYVAAKDRVVKVSPTGEQTVVIKEDFSGPCGVTDLRFDNHGNLFIVYDNIVAKYDSDFQKEVIIDGSQFEPPMVWIVGIEFSSDYKKLYLADCRDKRAYIIPYLSKDFIEKSKPFPTNWGQYFTQDNSGNVYLTSLGDNPEWPEFVMLSPENDRVDICCKNRIPQNRENHKKAMALGQKGFNKHAIYCIIRNRIYEYELTEITSVSDSTTIEN